MGKRKSEPITRDEWIVRDAEVNRRVTDRMTLPGNRMGPPKLVHGRRLKPRDPEALFTDLVAWIRIGAVDLAREAFLVDVAIRESWQYERGRATETEYARVEGERGNPKRGLSETQARRVKLFLEFRTKYRSDARALAETAMVEKVTEAAIRESLKRAGLTISTRSVKRT